MKIRIPTYLTVLLITLWFSLWLCFGCGQAPKEDINLSGQVWEGQKPVKTILIDGRVAYLWEWHNLSFQDAVIYRWSWGMTLQDGKRIETGWETGYYDPGSYREMKSFLVTFRPTKTSNVSNPTVPYTFEVTHDPQMNSYIMWNMTWHVKGAIPKVVSNGANRYPSGGNW